MIVLPVKGPSYTLEEKALLDANPWSKEGSCDKCGREDKVFLTGRDGVSLELKAPLAYLCARCMHERILGA